MASGRSQAGFTLIEVVVVLVLIALAAGALAPLASGQIRTQRANATRERMERAIVGMLGDPERGDHGYLGDLGELPPTLADLNERGTKPAFAVDPNDGIGAGYNGPYVPMAGPAGSAFTDGWGTAFAYAGAAAQLTSAGPDRTFGNGDDLVYPASAPPNVGNLSVSVLGVPNDGGASCLLGDDDADTFVSFSSSGTRNEVQLAGPIGTGGPFVGTGLHRGFHGVRVVGEGAFLGAAARDVVELLGGNATLRTTLVQPAGPAPACGP